MFTTPAFDLVVLDLAGTTVVDDGLVEQAFIRAADRTKLCVGEARAAAVEYVRATMGMSKIDVFTHLAERDHELAELANDAFEAAIVELIGEGAVQPIPGAAEVIVELRESRRKIAFTTGFSPATRDAILSALGWVALADVALSPADVGRGRPAPDLVLTALVRTGSHSTNSVAVVGDTVSDIECGLRAGARLVVGVLSGGTPADDLVSAGAHAVIDDITGLRDLLLV